MTEKELSAINDAQRRQAQKVADFFTPMPARPFAAPAGYYWGITKLPHENAFYELIKG